MAPELKKLKFNGNGIADETAMIDGCKADIYSLGITMLLLMNPYVKKSPDMLLQRLAENINTENFKFKEACKIAYDMVQNNPE